MFEDNELLKCLIPYIIVLLVWFDLITNILYTKEIVENIRSYSYYHEGRGSFYSMYAAYELFPGLRDDIPFGSTGYYAKCGNAGGIIYIDNCYYKSRVQESWLTLSIFTWLVPLVFGSLYGFFNSFDGDDSRKTVFYLFPHFTIFYIYDPRMFSKIYWMDKNDLSSEYKFSRFVVKIFEDGIIKIYIIYIYFFCILINIYIYK